MSQMSGLTCSPQGGDHTITLPLLRGVAEVYGPVSVIHFDSHIGQSCSMGTKLGH
jgi:arginase family enzyme